MMTPKQPGLMSAVSRLLRAVPLVAVLTLASGSAFALGTSEPDMMVARSALTHETTYAPSSDMTLVRPLLSAPDDLPALVSGVASASEKQLFSELQARHALERQIFWRYSNHNLDLAPWYRAAQSKKHAALTGPSQLLILLLTFAVMSGLTLVLWRQMASLVPQKRKPNSPPRRLS